MIKNIRDLLVGPPHPSENETLRSIALRREGPTPVEALLGRWAARLPGDQDDHPLADTGRNPIPGTNVQEVYRAVRSGKLSPDVEHKARAYIDQFQRLTNQAVHDLRNHADDD